VTDLSSRVAVVVGSGSGIGRATARCLAERGASVVVADINETGAHTVTEEIRARGGTAMAVTVDVAEERSVAAMITAAVEEFGRLDVIHNNAAALGDAVLGRDGDVASMDAEVWDTTMAVNARGVMFGCKYAVPEMIKVGGGSIINTTSVSARRGLASKTAYGCSKAAVSSLTLYVAAAYGKDGIRCNAVAPGATRSEYILSQRSEAELDQMLDRYYSTPRLGDPEDLARVVAFLASDDSAFITGTIIDVDGGFLTRMPYGAQTIEREGI
jgi:NAD(P)-dependent dehydrogenase (short-subunit alcohol dehydrogenase family)